MLLLLRDFHFPVRDDTKTGHLISNAGKDLGPALDVLLLPGDILSLGRNNVDAHANVHFADASEVSVEDGIEECSDALGIFEVENSYTVEHRSSLVVDGLASQ